MQDDPRYDDVVAEVYDFLARRIECRRGAGHPPRRGSPIDPGIGFGKTLEHNLELLRNLDRFANLGCAVLIGTSRKGFLGTLTGRPVDQRADGLGRLVAGGGRQRGAASSGSTTSRPMVDAIKVWTAVRGWEETP